ncbi:hypothetical protein GCM10023334_037630 [Nonomuraea thailandensis]
MLHPAAAGLAERGRLEDLDPVLRPNIGGVQKQHWFLPVRVGRAATPGDLGVQWGRCVPFASDSR